MKNPHIKVDISSENVKSNERMNLTVANRVPIWIIYWIQPSQKHDAFFERFWKKKGEISTVYSGKGIQVCAYYVFKSASTHTLKKCRDYFGKCAYIISAMYLDLKSNKRNVLLCCRKERIFLPQIHYLTISKATSVHACINLERGIIQHPGIKEVLIRLCAEYSATYNFKIAMMYNE